MARGLPRAVAKRTLLSQLAEAVLLAGSVLGLAAGAAAIPAAALGLAGNLRLVTGDPARQAVTPERCQQLRHLVAAPTCGQALGLHHLEEVIRNHFLLGWLGTLALAGWWLWHTHRRVKPAVLPAGFSLTVCGTLLGVAGLFLLAIGMYNAVIGVVSIGGVVGSGDLAATGATMMAAAVLCWAMLARQATRPVRNLAGRPVGWPR